MHVNEISKYWKIFENELYDQNYWQLPFDQIISVHLCGLGEIKKGKNNETANEKDLSKALQMLFKAKTQLGTKVKKHGTWYDPN